MRFQVEAVAHELRNPGWFARWLARKSAPAGVAPAGARVKLPMSPWMAFVHVSIASLRSLHRYACSSRVSCPEQLCPSLLGHVPDLLNVSN